MTTVETWNKKMVLWGKLHKNHVMFYLFMPYCGIDWSKELMEQEDVLDYRYQYLGHKTVGQPLTYKKGRIELDLPF